MNPRKVIRMSSALPERRESTTRERGARQALARARRRRRERGTLFIEALFVTLVMGAMLASISFFHGGYHAKAETQQRARALAWVPALAGCELQSPEILAAAQPAEVTLTAAGNGMHPRALVLATRTTVTCNEPSRRKDVTLADALDTLRKIVPWGQPIDMARWFFGASQPFAGMYGALEFLGRWVTFASDGVSQSLAVLAPRFAEVTDWLTRATQGALDWVASLL
jgi:hypothetical protein